MSLNRFRRASAAADPSDPSDTESSMQRFSSSSVWKEISKVPEFRIVELSRSLCTRRGRAGHVRSSAKADVLVGALLPIAHGVLHDLLADTKVLVQLGDPGLQSLFR